MGIVAGLTGAPAGRPRGGVCSNRGMVMDSRGEGIPLGEGHNFPEGVVFFLPETRGKNLFEGDISM